jgi:uncharacterized protein with HEPN domain
MSERDNSFLVGDISESGKKIISSIGEMTFDEFMRDSKTIDGVIRNFEIIGEAANRLTAEYKQLNFELDWHRLRGFRNRIVHDYMGIDYSIVWKIKENFLPGLLSVLQSLR